MATLDWTTGSAGANPAAMFGDPKVVRVRIDMRKRLPANADVGQILPVKAGTHVRYLGTQVVQAEGAALTIDIGDGVTPNGYVAGVNLNSAGFVAGTLALTEGTPNTITGFTNGKLYTVDDTVDVVVNNASADVAVADVYFQLTSLNIGPPANP